MEGCECLKSSFLFDLARQVFDRHSGRTLYVGACTHILYIYIYRMYTGAHVALMLFSTFTHTNYVLCMQNSTIAN